MGLGCMGLCGARAQRGQALRDAARIKGVHCISSSAGLSRRLVKFVNAACRATGHRRGLARVSVRGR